MSIFTKSRWLIFLKKKVQFEQLEKIYLMAYTKINLLEKNYVEASAALSEIEKLKDNWNDNGASSFSSKLVEKCREIAMQLAAEPFICPTACGSIQFEYEKEKWRLSGSGI